MTDIIFLYEGRKAGEDVNIKTKAGIYHMKIFGTFNILIRTQCKIISGWELNDNCEKWYENGVVTGTEYIRTPNFQRNEVFEFPIFDHGIIKHNSTKSVATYYYDIGTVGMIVWRDHGFKVSSKVFNMSNFLIFESNEDKNSMTYEVYDSLGRTSEVFNGFWKTVYAYYDDTNHIKTLSEYEQEYGSVWKLYHDDHYDSNGERIQTCYYENGRVLDYYAYFGRKRKDEDEDEEEDGDEDEGDQDEYTDL